MKAIDLMIGDYVTFKDCQNDDAPTIVKIEGLGYQGRGVVEEALVTIDGDENGFDLVEIDDEFVGIPLTPEILEKNFEKKTFYGIYDDYFDLDIREYSDSIYVATFHNCEASFPDQSVTLSFVHELQHFLNHCGIEHEITL